MVLVREKPTYGQELGLWVDENKKVGIVDAVDKFEEQDCSGTLEQRPK